MKKTICFLFLSFLICHLSIFSFNPTETSKDLPSKYKEWLDLVTYVITPAEKTVFLKLTSDRDRDIFIASFWKQRDPTPATPQNEFQEEHMKRFLYANEYFRRGTTRPGWMTDMGRIYIILGQPASIERFEGSGDIYPTQVWYYYGDQKLELPPNFAVIFYKRGGSGEFKLYSPAGDGPASLLIMKDANTQVTDPYALYKKLKEAAPTLANVSLSLIPGEIPYSYQPSPKSNIILSNIMAAPTKNIRATYATNFLNYKGLVTIEYSTNYVECESDLVLLKDPISAMNFLHFSINPKKLSIDYYKPKNQYYFNLQLSVSLRKDDKIIFQYTNDYPFYFVPEDSIKIQAGGISIQDFFPVTEGKYKVIVLLRNSVGKEFCYFEKDIEVPEQSDSPAILEAILGYDLQDDKSISHIPYKLEQQRLLRDPKNTFSVKDKNITLCLNVINVSKALWEEGTLEISTEGSQEKDAGSKKFTIALKEYPYGPVMVIFKSFSAGDFPPDYYQLELVLKNSTGHIFDTKKLNFAMTPSLEISHPAILFKSLPPINEFLFFYMLACQADKMNNDEKASQYFERLLSLNPQYQEGIIQYAYFLLKMKQFNKALQHIESVKDNSQYKFDYFLIKGRALMGLEKFSEAVEYLLEGNKIYNSDTRVLNALGYCFFKMGKKQEALNALKASLSLNPQQDDVKRLLQVLETPKDSNRSQKK